MGVRVVSMMLRAAFVVTLILGILFWTGALGGPLVLLHMLLGLIIVGCVWYLGVAQALKGGSLGLTFGTFIAGLAVALVGLFQQGVLVGSSHWVIQIIHLLLALAAVGLGEASVARYRRSAVAVAAR